MLTWLAVKTFLKKVWVFIKHYWYMPLFAVVGLVYLIWKGKSGEDKVFKVLEVTKESHKKELEAVNRVHSEELEKRDKLIKKYQETISQLEKEYEKKEKTLTKKEKETVKELAKKYEKDPEAYTREIANYFGFTFVESE